MTAPIPFDSPPPAPISQHCYVVWERHDRQGLIAYVREHGKIRVRVPVPRQIWPEPTIGAA